MFTDDQLKQAAVEIEKWCARYVSNELKAMQKSGGEKMSHELYASVAALFAGRAVAMLHIWTGEPLASVRERLIEAMDFNTGSQINTATNGLKP